jgi:hypothetical protein
MTIVYDAVEEKVKSKYFSFDFTIRWRSVV